MKLLLVPVLLTYVCQAMILLANTGLPQENSLRELCRKQVAGKYLTAFDERRRAQDFANELAHREKDLIAAKASAEAQAKKALEDNRDNANLRFDIEAERTRKAKQQFVDDLKLRMEENKQLESKNKIAFKQADEIVKTLEPRLKKVFRIEILQSDLRQEYPFSMLYKESCPRFQVDCKLSRGSAYDLLKIFDADEPVPEPCAKYTALSGVTR